MPRREDDRLSPRTVERLREYVIDPGVPGEGIVWVSPTAGREAVPPAPSPRPYDHQEEA